MSSSILFAFLEADDRKVYEIRALAPDLYAVQDEYSAGCGFNLYATHHHGGRKVTGFDLWFIDTAGMPLSDDHPETWLMLAKAFLADSKSPIAWYDSPQEVKIPFALVA